MNALKQALRAWGWPAWLGGALLLAGLLLAAAATSRWQAEADEARQEAESLKHRAATRAQAANPAPAASWRSWRAGLPPAAERQEQLANLLELALRHGVTVARSEQRIEPQGALGVERYRVAMPASGSYADLRGFIEEALLRSPALSLDSLRLRRASPSAPEVEAELQWSFVLRSDVPEAAR